MKKLYRVIVQWTFNGLSFMTERGVKADDPGEALRAALASCRIDRADGYKALIEESRSLADFSNESSWLPVVNGQGESIRAYYGA